MAHYSTLHRRLWETSLTPFRRATTYARIRTLWGLEKAGRRIREKITLGVEAAKRNDTIRQRGKFLWLTHQTVPPVRRFGIDRPSNLVYVCDEEITEAIKAVQRDEGVSPKEALVKRTGQRLGIQSTSQDTATRIRRLVKPSTWTVIFSWSRFT
jgi:hypothetical protein